MSLLLLFAGAEAVVVGPDPDVTPQRATAHEHSRATVTGRARGTVHDHSRSTAKD